MVTAHDTYWLSNKNLWISEVSDKGCNKLKASIL